METRHTAGERLWWGRSARAASQVCVALGVCAALSGVAHGQDVLLGNAELGDRGFVGKPTTYTGRFALRDVFSLDNQTDFGVHLLFLDADLNVQNLAAVGERGQVNFQLDSRFLLDFTQQEQVSTNEFTAAAVKRNERRFGVTQTFADVREAYFEVEKLGPVDVRAGRVWLYQAGGAWADGAQLNHRLSKTWSTGFFGGLQPDPFTFLPTTDRQTAGTYAAYEADRFQWSAAYTAQLFGGGLDRHFLFSRAHASVPVGDWGKSLFLSYYATLDMPNAEAQVDNPVLTTFFANSSYWVSDTLNFGFNYARFATQRLSDPRQRRFAAEENQRPLLGDLVNQGAYNQYRLSAVQRFSHYHVYQQIDIRDRDLIDERTAIYYRAGVRDNAFLGTQLYLHGRITVRNNFLSDSTEFMLESAYRFGSSFELSGATAYQTGRSLVSFQDQDVIFVNGRATYDFNPDLYLSLDYDLTVETNIQQEELETAGDLLVHTIFTRLTYRL